MFTNFILALTKRIVEILSKGEDLEKAKIPQAIKDYLKDASDKEILEDLSLVADFALEGTKSRSTLESGLMKAIVRFLTTDFASKLDFLDSDIALYSKEKRREIISKIINSDSPLATELKEIMINFTYEQIADEIFKLASKIDSLPYIIVQSPREISVELKREIREKLSRKSPVFPIFQTNQKLIGGIRIFQNGENLDFSWLARVLQFTSLTKA